MSALSFFTALRKNATVPDVHVSSAGGAKKKPKPVLADPEEEDEHLPVTNMTLAAQQITGQSPAKKFEVSTLICKVDESHGLVMGWAIVSKSDGADYFDLQGDHIPEDAMLAASVDFMGAGAMAKEMHAGNGKGVVLFAFPMTGEIAKAFGIETKTTGLMIAMKPDTDAMLAKFRDGTYTGFSIGGFRITDEEVT